MRNENKERLVLGYNYKESDMKSRLDYLITKWEITPIEDIITPEDTDNYRHCGVNDYVLRCRTCGLGLELGARDVLGLNDCIFCLDIAELLASHSFGCLEKVKHEDIQSALDEFRDFFIDIQDLMLKELEIPQRTDLIPRFECLTEVLCSLEIIGPGIKFYYEYLFRKAHQLAIALIIDLSAWIQETEHLVDPDGPHYPLPWRNDSSNQISIERALSTLENLKKSAINQKLWIKHENSFRGPPPSELSSTSSFASEISGKLPWEE